MYGCFVTEPEADDSDLGVVFFHTAGYSTACGHGTIALVTWAVESGVVAATEPETRVVVDCPSGRLDTVARVEGGDVTAVRFRNVPSFVHARGLEAARRTVDVAFGGAFYAFLEEQVEPGDWARIDELLTVYGGPGAVDASVVALGERSDGLEVVSEHRNTDASVTDCRLGPGVANVRPGDLSDCAPAHLPVPRLCRAGGSEAHEWPSRARKAGVRRVGGR